MESLLEKVFQSTPLREGRLNNLTKLLDAKDFNPRPYERGDSFQAGEDTRFAISIHAPTRGATTPPPRHQAHRTDFNPRPYERGD